MSLSCQMYILLMLTVIFRIGRLLIHSGSWGKMRQAYSLLSLYTYVNLFVCRYLLLCLLNDSAQQHNINVVLIKQSHQFFIDLLPCNM